MSSEPKAKARAKAKQTYTSPLSDDAREAEIRRVIARRAEQVDSREELDRWYERRNRRLEALEEAARAEWALHHEHLARVHRTLAYEHEYAARALAASPEGRNGRP